MNINFQEIKMQMRGREMEFLRGYVASEYLTKRSGPCPSCGGTTKYRLLDEKNGSFVCNDYERLAGDVLANVVHCTGMTLGEVKREAIVFLGLEAPTEQVKKEIAERRARIMAKEAELVRLNTDRMQMLGLMNEFFGYAATKQGITQDERDCASDLIKAITATYKGREVIPA